MAVTGSEAQIADALFWHVGQMVTDPVTRVSYPGVSFDPAGAPFVQVNALPNTADAVGLEWTSPIQHVGMLRVVVFWPRPAGLIAPMQVAGQVVAHFKRGTRIERTGAPSIRIDAQPRLSPAISESDWQQVPVTIAWRAVAPAPA